MFDRSTSSDSSVLRSEAHLTAKQDPEKPIGRTSELETIAATLRPLTRRKPGYLLVHGPAGVGKTTAINHVLDQLKMETRIKPTFINCWQYTTRPSLFTELLIQMGYPAPRKGKPVDELLSRIKEWLDKNRSVALVLDEFDQLDDKGAVLYNLYQLNQQADNSIGIIIISNQPPESLDLDPRTESRIACNELEFQPYTTEELEAILQERAKQAFHPGAVSDNVVATIASTVAERTGDCRRALEHLLNAGRLADRRNETEITDDVLKDALER